MLARAPARKIGAFGKGSFNTDCRTSMGDEEATIFLRVTHVECAESTVDLLMARSNGNPEACHRTCPGNEVRGQSGVAIDIAQRSLRENARHMENSQSLGRSRPAGAFGAGTFAFSAGPAKSGLKSARAIGMLMIRRGRTRHGRTG